MDEKLIGCCFGLGLGCKAKAKDGLNINTYSSSVRPARLVQRDFSIFYAADSCIHPM